MNRLLETSRRRGARNWSLAESSHGPDPGPGGEAKVLIASTGTRITQTRSKKEQGCLGD